MIGAGGMGEVYRARDTKLGRDVALKILPESFAMDAERLSRFEREARILAALNHGNIATIHGIEQFDSQRFLVLELVDGEDLAKRLALGPIAVEDTLAVCLQITEALEAAHEQGVIHRDLKPANIIVTPDGNVKVLDFGLAKALEMDAAPGDLSHSPTVLASSPTIAGVILGTAPYMSPEQARGKTVDRRADIFSFGAVLFEMLTGQ
ncbi:MAG: serine/threonine protein kinase, partial [Candidatus Krumholzibacteriota bacterium]|nr:serine/threonine protein kinase [Candidatus Krumholzibacteriota bacterium]